MDWKTALDWYCSGNILDEEDLQILEKQFQKVIENPDIETTLELAPKHICNQTKIPEGSSWISAVSIVLDRLSPVQNGEPRSLIIDQLRRKKANTSLYRKS